MQKQKKRFDEPENKPKGNIPAMPSLKPPSVEALLNNIEDAFEEEENEACGCWGRA
jgi:hypothetical protein